MNDRLKILTGIAGLGVALMIALSSCGQQNSPAPGGAADDGKIKIGLSFDSLLVERWQKDRDIFVAEAERLGAECVFLSADGDAKKQNDQRSLPVQCRERLSVHHQSCCPDQRDRS